MASETLVTGLEKGHELEFRHPDVERVAEAVPRVSRMRRAAITRPISSSDKEKPRAESISPWQLGGRLKPLNF